ncbi:pyridoxamine 5'-phosphate oxidase family protein [Candidatus Parcubacteria bacterium]|nr:pyridoxamine 5'-phosphate oxidase family protein [Candidatus Parcubacteria bacterium]
MTNNERAKGIIQNIIYVTIATVDESGQPWNTPVYSAYDQDYNFYWGSYRDSQHSKNIRSTGRIFLAIYDSTVEAGTGYGVYAKAKGFELNDPAQIKFAHQLLEARRQSPYWEIEQVQDDGPVRLYKAVPEQSWINDGGTVDGSYIDKLTEVKLP